MCTIAAGIIFGSCAANERSARVGEIRQTGEILTRFIRSIDDKSCNIASANNTQTAVLTPLYSRSGVVIIFINDQRY